MKLCVVLIHDDLELRRLLTNLLEAWTPHEVNVEPASFSARLPGAWKHWLEKADLFVVGLERWYPDGVRAEGVAVAQSLFGIGKKALIVGSECSADSVPFLFYWDLASNRTFLEAVAGCLEAPLPPPNDLNAFSSYFQKRLATPTGHSPKSKST